MISYSPSENKRYIERVRYSVSTQVQMIGGLGGHVLTVDVYYDPLFPESHALLSFYLSLHT